MIFYIVGKSASGKDTIFKDLLKKELGLNKVIMWTTRPQRENEVDGVDYHFVTEKFLLDNENLIIEKRKYDTCFGPWYYATLIDDNISNDENYIMIGTLESYNKIKKYYGEENVYPIYVEVPDDIRYERAKEREKREKVPKFEEMERRFRADNIDFSEENIRNANINKRYANIDYDKCLQEIIMDIKKKLN